MFEVVLHEPEIAPNTGNVIRLCANVGARLHLIEPLGFAMDDRRLRRAGLDYDEFVDVARHRHFGAFEAAVPDGRLIAFTTRSKRWISDFAFAPGDRLLFGPETRGLSGALLERVPDTRTLRLPMVPGSRSLNLANAVAVATYEAWRQLGFEGAA
ncbi:MAG: tRNA (cytidine(34)-2'-O)-methyltransferase [Pseudomonadota bacterium]